MITQPTAETQVLLETSARAKIARLPTELDRLMAGGGAAVPELPGRDVQILPIRQLPAKTGLSTRAGQARLLHDLASIELQAMELGLRTLAEFPEAPPDFRRQLAAVTAEEGHHLQLCLDGLDALDAPWGSFPAHLGLWQAVDKEDSLLDRVLIVHRYLEGSGLDASETLLRRLSGVQAGQVSSALQVIRRDEVGHVQFGSRWYHQLVRAEGGDPVEDFTARLEKLCLRVPRRREPIQAALRESAGFLPGEVAALEEFRRKHQAVRELPSPLTKSTHPDQK